MPSLLKGSCHCERVTFEVQSHTPYAYMYCYCSICRVTNGSGGFGINIMGQTDTLKIKGEEYIKVFRAKRGTNKDGTVKYTTNERSYCTECASFLWAFDEAYAQWMYPFPSAIKSDLPQASQINHIFTDSKPSWVPLPVLGYKTPEGKGEELTDTQTGIKHRFYAEYPDEGIEQWHKRVGVFVE
ncbi:hypothetical protein HK097_009824 [Rhizophlyctis rosea]|uniref:CENP-V/GFA domain-containing protein n=1 Tax=Rhizophlyctis rosea TaxID=64517 RepID=A0AAD5SB65_9FUNG|nr:hypothetical protein HK097_009824 [Rhizophlyctis rosea]